MILFFVYFSVFICINSNIWQHCIACVVPNSEPCQIITPLVLVGLGLGVGLKIRQSYSDFNERGNNLAGGRKWAQHRHLNWQ